MAITLSRTERLILINQFRILAALIPDEAQDYQRSITIAERGFSAEYGDLFQGIDPEGLSPEECDFVRRVLDMFWSLQDCFEKNVDRGDLQERDVIFPGFDGNNELAFIAYAKFMIEDGEFRGLRCAGGLNCHHETTERYMRMLERFERVPPLHRRELSVPEIKELLA